jgi:CDP-diacylglycerol---serine O-phosphatidyltransferase
MKYIPNFITSLNLTSGFIAIIFAANGNLITASWLIVAAMIFDFMDGFSARLLHAYSDIGKELDSLADVVSFGVAPGIIIYQMLNDSLSLHAPIMANSNNILIYIILLSPAIMPVLAALRLAIFNIDTTQKTSFKGLPTPASAIAVISVVLAGHYSPNAIFNSFSDSPILIMVYTLILSFLMVSKIPLLSLKVSNLKFKGNEGLYILIGLLAVSFAILGAAAAPLIIPFYILASFISRLL